MQAICSGACQRLCPDGCKLAVGFVISRHMFYKRISPKQLSERLNTGKLKFIDVREPVEYEIARVEKAELLPLSRFNEWIETLKPEDEIVVMCHHGVRSANVCMYLAQNGFENVSNLEGGIDFWSIEVDENVPRY